MMGQAMRVTLRLLWELKLQQSLLFQRHCRFPIADCHIIDSFLFLHDRPRDATALLGWL
jgi:hypothetical protein